MARRTTKPKDGLKIVGPSPSDVNREQSVTPLFPSTKTKQEVEKGVKNLLGALPCFGCSKPLDASEAWAVEVKRDEEGTRRKLFKWLIGAHENCLPKEQGILVLQPSDGGAMESLVVLPLLLLANLLHDIRASK